MTSIVYGEGPPGGGFDQQPIVKPRKSFQFNPTPQTGGFTPSVATGGQQQFGPQNNLIGSQFNPIPSVRGTNAAGMTDKAAGAVSNYQFQPFNPMGPANTAQSQGIYDNLLKQANAPVSGVYGGGGAQLNMQLQPLLDKVTNAPDRGQLASDMYGVLEDRARPQFEQRLRSVGQKAAALGRVGAGLTTSELGDVETTHNRDLDLSRRQLAAEGAGYSLDDRLKQLGAARDVYGSVQSANSAANAGAYEMNRDKFNNNLTLARDLYGRESDTYGRGLGERDAGLNYDQTRFGNERSRLQDSSLYENDIYNQDRSNRDEMRGERGYQYGLERDAQGDRERQYGMEEDAKSRDWDRAYQAAQFGYGTNPAGAYGAQAGQKASGAQDLMSQFGPLFQEWAKRNRQPAASGVRPADLTDLNIPTPGVRNPIDKAW